jgi:hypothetical protein
MEDNTKRPADAPIPEGYTAAPITKLNGVVIDPGLYQLIKIDEDAGEDLTIPADLGQMSHKEQVTLFQNRLRCLVNEFRREYSLSYAEAVGTLHIVTGELTNECLSNQQEED